MSFLLEIESLVLLFFAKFICPFFIWKLSLEISENPHFKNCLFCSESNSSFCYLCSKLICLFLLWKLYAWDLCKSWFYKHLINKYYTKMNEAYRKCVGIVKPLVKCSVAELNKWLNNDQHNVIVFFFSIRISLSVPFSLFLIE